MNENGEEVHLLNTPENLAIEKAASSALKAREALPGVTPRDGPTRTLTARVDNYSTWCGCGITLNVGPSFYQSEIPLLGYIQLTPFDRAALVTLLWKISRVNLVEEVIFVRIPHGTRSREESLHLLVVRPITRVIARLAVQRLQKPLRRSQVGVNVTLLELTTNILQMPRILAI